ncbi:unnamed protein product [Effrenium voratum]|uniref:Uncharacterized protein n=1 Tax=Effrenium voratum TaxID=2562239 RepID=A0AA36NIS3_9DINO|nr:unnamed protein product [Effrenium voratum]
MQRPKLDTNFCLTRCKPIWLPIKAHRFAAYRAKVLQLLPQRVLQQYIDFEKQGQYSACIKLLESATPGSLNVLSPATMVSGKPLLVETVLQLIVGYSGLCLKNQQGSVAVKLITQVLDNMSLSLRDLHPGHRTVLEAETFDTALSVCYYMPNDVTLADRSQSFFQQASERYLRLGHINRYCKCCLRAAAVLHLQGSKSEAEYYTQQALNKLSDAPVSSLLAVCYHNLAVHTVVQHRIADSVAHVRMMFSTLKNQNDNSLVLVYPRFATIGLGVYGVRGAVLLPHLRFGLGLPSLPDLVTHGLGPIRLHASACFDPATDQQESCCAGTSAACFAEPFTWERCCWEDLGGLEVVSDNFTTAEDLQLLAKELTPSAAFQLPEPQLARLLVAAPQQVRVLRRSRHGCLELGSSTLLGWLKATKSCGTPLRLSCLSPPPGVPLACRKLLGLSLQDAFANLLALATAVVPKDAASLRLLAAVLQQQNTHLWQLAARANAPGRPIPMPQVRFAAGAWATNGEEGEKRYHTIARVLQSYCLHCREGAVYAELGVWEGDTPHHLAQVALPYLAEIHLVEPNERILQLAGARLLSQAPGWSSCQMTAAPNAARARSRAIKAPALGLFACTSPDAFGAGRIFLHPCNATAAARLFARRALDVVFVDSMGRFKELLADLELYWAALRKGGVLLGHDFYHVYSGLQPFNDVVGAAMTFAVRKERQLFLTGDQTFWIVK